MNEFRHIPTSDAPGDPLERLVEAFVGQSAPEGPDAAIQLRLVAAMRAADAAGQRQLGRAVRDEQPHSDRSSSRVRRWLREGVQQLFVIAAGIALVIGAALALRAPQPVAPRMAHLNGGGSGIDAIEPEPAPSIVAEGEPADIRLAEELGRIAEEYLRTHDGRLPDRRTVEELLTTLVQKNPEFAKSDTWKFAHDRLTAALDQPRVLTLGVGILGTLPWTTYGRF